MTATLKSLPKPRTDNQACIEVIEDALVKAKAGEVNWILIALGNGDAWENSRVGLGHAEAMGFLHRFMHKMQQAWDSI